MSFQIAEAFVNVKTKMDPSAGDELAGQMESKLSGVSTKMNSIGKKMTAGVTLPIVAAGGAAFKMAADMNDAMGATEQIFGKASGSVQKWSGDLETYYGISRAEALEHANMMGSMLQNIGGQAEDEAAKTAGTLVELAGDLTAMYGGSTQDAIRALTGALKGNTTMLDNYGMAANDAMVKQKALEMGIWDGKGAMDLATKQAATLNLIMEQSAAAQGQAAREAGGASGQMRTLQTEFKNLATELGTKMLPIGAKILGFFSKLMGAFNGLPGPIQNFILVFAGIAAVVGPVLIVVSKIITAFQAIKTVIVGMKFASLMNPWVLAIMAVAGAVYLIYKNWDTIKEFLGGLVDWFADAFDAVLDFIKKWGPKFLKAMAFIFFPIPMLIATHWDKIKNIAGNVFNAMVDVIKSIFGALQQFFSTAFQVIGGIFRAGWEAIKTLTSTIFEAIKTIISSYIEAWKMIISTFLSWLASAWNTMKTAAAAAWNGVKAVVETVINAITAIVQRNINFWGSMLQAFGNMVMSILGTIGSTVASIFSNLWTTVSETFNNIVSFFVDLPQRILDTLGDLASAVFDFGKQIIEGLANGIKAAWDKIPGVIKKPVEWVINGAKDLLGVESPSKVFDYIGRMTGEGFAQGIEKSNPLVRRATQGMMNDATGIGGSFGSSSVSTSNMGGIYISTLQVNANNADEFTESMQGIRQRIRARG